METDDLMKPRVEQARGVPPKRVVVPVVVLIFGVLLVLSFISSEQDEPIQRGDDVAKKNEIKLSDADRMQMKGAQKIVGESYAASGLTPEMLLSSKIESEPSKISNAVSGDYGSIRPNTTDPKTNSIVAQAQLGPSIHNALDFQNSKATMSSSPASLTNSANRVQLSTALPSGQPQRDGVLALESKNDLLAVKAAKEIEVLNSKMVVADFDDRLPGSGVGSSGLFSTQKPTGALGLSEEQMQSLSNLKQKAIQLSASNPMTSPATVPAQFGLSAPQKAGLASNLFDARDAAMGPDKGSLQKATELIAAWNTPMAESGAVEGSSRQSASHVSNDNSFLKEFASSSGSSAGLRPRRLESAGSVLEGSVIPAVLARDIVSDLPGTLTALVSQDVYDSLTSSSVLICKGSKLVGRYNHDVRVGQSRLMFAFTRLILNTGESFDLTGFEGSDALGRAGFEGDVNNHFLKIYGSSLAIGVLADQVTKQSQIPQGTFAQPSATGQIMVQTTREILSRTREVSPTITIEHGTPINVEVRRDLIFPNTKRSRCT
jgi:type IV secretion system protein VirB10